MQFNVHHQSFFLCSIFCVAKPFYRHGKLPPRSNLDSILIWSCINLKLKNENNVHEQSVQIFVFYQALLFFLSFFDFQWKMRYISNVKSKGKKRCVKWPPVTNTWFEINAIERAQNIYSRCYQFFFHGFYLWISIERMRWTSIFIRIWFVQINRYRGCDGSQAKAVLNCWQSVSKRIPVIVATKSNFNIPTTGSLKLNRW